MVMVKIIIIIQASCSYVALFCLQLRKMNRMRFLLLLLGLLLGAAAPSSSRKLTIRKMKNIILTGLSSYCRGCHDSYK